MNQNQSSKGPVRSPSIDIEILIQRKNVSSPEFTGEVDQTGIGKVSRQVAVLAQNTPDFDNRSGYTKRNLEHARSDILQHSLSGPAQVAKQIATLGDYRFARHEWRFHSADCFDHAAVKTLATVEKCDDHPCVKQGRFQRPKSFRWALLLPRSGTPERNCPIPAIFRGAWP